LTPAPSDLALELPDGFRRLASQAAQPATDPLPGLRSFIRSQHQGGAGTQGGGEHREGDEAAALAGDRIGGRRFQRIVI
jgi:hypothetical protein